MALGMSNPREVQRAMTAGVPVIHVQRDCHVLQEAQQRRLRCVQVYRVIGGLVSSVLWGFLFGQKWSNRIKYPAMASLALYTFHWMRSRRHDYYQRVTASEYFLIRNDAVQSRLGYIMCTWVPYCILGATVFYGIRRHKNGLLPLLLSRF